MKNYSILAGILATCAVSMSWTRPAVLPSSQEEPKDSTITLITWADPGDTAVYWIDEGTMQVKDGDTTNTPGTCEKVRLIVTKASKKGYSMKLEYLDFKAYQTPDNANFLERIQNELTNKLAANVIGTVIKFRTDIFGRITKYENLDEIKKRAETLYRKSCEEIVRMPFLDSLRAKGIDLQLTPEMLMKGYDAKAAVKGYTEELETMFELQGYTFDVEESDRHEDATDKKYASDIHQRVSILPDDEQYEILLTTTTHIPMKDMKSIVKASVTAVAGDIATDEEFEEKFNNEVGQDNDIMSTSMDYRQYWNDGWPNLIIKQSIVSFSKLTKITQKRILLLEYHPGKPQE